MIKWLLRKHFSKKKLNNNNHFQKKNIEMPCVVKSVLYQYRCDFVLMIKNVVIVILLSSFFFLLFLVVLFLFLDYNATFLLFAHLVRLLRRGVVRRRVAL